MFRHPLSLRGLFALILAIAVASPALAQQDNRGQRGDGPPLADRLPSEAIVYVGWVGAERMAELWEGTHTQALVQQSNFEDLFARYVPELLDRLAEEEPEAAQAIRLVRELLPLFVKRPSAFAFGGMNAAAGGAPVPRLIFAIDAGDQADALEQRIRGIMRQAGQQPLAMFLGNENGVVRFAMGYDLDELDRLAAGEGANSLGASDAFSATMGKLTAAPTFAIYVDFARLVSEIEAAAVLGGPESQQQVRQMFDALGARGFRQLGLSSGFAGQLYETQAFLGYSGDEGILGLMPAGPLDQQALASVPAGSTMVSATQFDIGKLLPVIRAIINQIEPDAEARFDELLEQADAAAGVDLQEDLLSQFGTTWAFYVSPRIGSGIFSGVIINRPRDPAKLEQALTDTSRNLLDLANQFIIPQSDGMASLPGRSLQVDGQTLHILNTPFLAPTWSTDNQAGIVRFAFYPQSILSARALAGEESFMKSAKWRQLSDKLGADGEVAGIEFYDLPELAPDAYPIILLFSQGAIGMGDLFGEYLGTRPPVVVLPPLATILAHTEPAGAVAWVTEDGLRYRMIEPYPMSTLLTMDWQSWTVQQQTTMISILLPALNRAREAANRINSGSNLRQMGQAMRQIAIDDVREGRYPPDIQTLFLKSELPLEVFISPRSGTAPPEMMAQSREVQAQWVAENSDFVYIGGGLTDSAPSTVMVAYEDPEKIGWNEGVNVLFADGSVRFIPLFEFDAEVQRHIEYRRQKNLPIPEELDD